MAVASLPGRLRVRRGRTILTTLLIAVAVVAILGSEYTADGVASAGGTPTASHATAGTALNPVVVSAEASLARGAGPAAGIASSCTTASGGSVQCSLPAPVRPASSTSPVWSDLTQAVGSNIPTPRWLGAMAYDPVDGYVLLFGGADSTASFSDTWTYASGVWTELSPGSAPAARYVASMTWDASDGYLLLFGGYDATGAIVYNDTWSYLAGTWTNVSPTVSPAPRWRQSMAYDPTDGYVVMFGGTNAAGSTVYADTWTYVAGVWTDMKSVTGSPPGRYRAQMVWDASDGYAVLFGGCTSSNCPDQSTWTYLGDAWTQQSITSKPSARVYYGIAYDSSDGYVVMYGGAGTSGLNVADGDTWSYHNATWTQLTSVGTAPFGRGYVMMTYDPLDNYSLMFGGANPASQTTFYNNTYALGPAVIGNLVATPSVIDEGQSVRLDATPLASQGTLTFNYSGLPPGCTNANVTVLTCTPTAQGNYSVSVSISSTSGTSATKHANLTVNSDPVITAFTSSLAVVTVGSTFTVNATAVNGTLPYRYGYSGLPSGCGSTNHPGISCTPTVNGTFTIHVTVTDGANDSVAQSLMVLVNAKPGLLAFLADPSTIDAGQSTTIFANVSGGTAPLTYTYIGLPAGCASANLSRITCTPSATGPATINLNVSDAFGWYVHGSLLLTVDVGPLVDNFAADPLTVDLGGTSTFWLNGSLGTGTLTYSYSGLPSGCNLGRAATGACTPSVTGTFTVVGMVTDALGFTASSTLTLTVNPDPSVASVTVAPGSIDARQTASIVVAVQGGTAPFTYTYTGLPIGCAGTSTAFLNCTVGTAGIYTIVAMVSDHFQQTSQLAGTLTVNAVPSVSSFTASINPVSTGASTTLLVATSGGNGGYTFVYLGLPNGCSSANTSSLACTPTASGTFSVNVTATDSLGVEATGSLTLVVQSGGGSGSTSSSLSGTLLYGLIALVVIVLVVAVAVVLMRRRPRPPAEAPAAPADEEWVEPG